MHFPYLDRAVTAARYAAAAARDELATHNKATPATKKATVRIKFRLYIAGKHSKVTQTQESQYMRAKGQVCHMQLIMWRHSMKGRRSSSRSVLTSEASRPVQSTSYHLVDLYVRTTVQNQPLRGLGGCRGCRNCICGLPIERLRKEAGGTGYKLDPILWGWGVKGGFTGKSTDNASSRSCVTG